MFNTTFLYLGVILLVTAIVLTLYGVYMDCYDIFPWYTFTFGGVLVCLMACTIMGWANTTCQWCVIAFGFRIPTLFAILIVFSLDAYALQNSNDYCVLNDSDIFVVISMGVCGLAAILLTCKYCTSASEPDEVLLN